MHLKISLFFLILVSVFSSCEVNEGVGGTATIKGSLILEQYNDDFSTLMNTQSAGDEKIYIQYGDSKTVSDDVETSYEGYFEFTYLYEGDYTVYYYSKDSLNPLDAKKEVLLEVHLDKGETIDLGELIVLETLDFDEGSGSIKGALFLSEYNDDFSILVNSLAASDEKIYIQYANSKTVEDDVETSYDGYFEFTYLSEGDYTLFYYSKDSLNPLDPKKEVLVEVHLDKGENIDLGEMKTLETLDFDEGKASLKGSVLEIMYWTVNIPKDTLMATDLPVYLRYGNHQQYDERIRTQGDGSFCFSNLIPGDYTIYVFSEDASGSDQQVAIETTITIPDNTIEEYVLEDLFIHNL